MEPKPKIPSYKKMTRKDRLQPKAENIWVEQKAWISKKTGDIINEMSAKYQIPKARIAAYLIDNALTHVEAAWEMKIPKIGEHVENEFAHEAKLLYDFLKDQSKPFGLDVLMIFRRDIGIESKERLVGAYYELLDADMIEEKYPHKHSFEFHPDYRAAGLTNRRYR